MPINSKQFHNLCQEREFKISKAINPQTSFKSRGDLMPGPNCFYIYLRLLRKTSSDVIGIKVSYSQRLRT